MTNLDPQVRDPHGPRCPSCGAMVLAGSAWCMLCHADLRTDEERAAARAAAAASAAASAEVGPALVGSPASRGRHRRGATSAPAPDSGSAPAPAPAPSPDSVPGPLAVPVVAPHADQAPDGVAAGAVAPGGPAVVEPAPPVTSLDEVDVDAMLEQLAAASPNPLGQLSGRMSDKTTKFLLVVGGAGLVALAGFVGLVILGLLVG